MNELYELVSPVCDREGGPGWPEEIHFNEDTDHWLMFDKISTRNARYILEGHLWQWLRERHDWLTISKQDDYYMITHIRQHSPLFSKDYLAALVAVVKWSMEQ